MPVPATCPATVAEHRARHRRPAPCPTPERRRTERTDTDRRTTARRRRAHPRRAPPATATRHDVTAGHHVTAAAAGGQRGSLQVLQDPVPSGLPYAEVQSSHVLGQQLADALAMEDWATARSLSPPLAGSSDATLADGLCRARPRRR